MFSHMSEINISDQLKNNKELSSNVKSLFRLLVLIIKTLVNRVPKKRTPKNKEKSKEEEVPPKELLEATQERTKLEELEEENERLKAELEALKIKAVNRESNKPSSKQSEWEPKGVGNRSR